MASIGWYLMTKTPGPISTRCAAMLADLLVIAFTWAKTSHVRKMAQKAHLRVGPVTLLVRDGKSTIDYAVCKMLNPSIGTMYFVSVLRYSCALFNGTYVLMKSTLDIDCHGCAFSTLCRTYNINFCISLFH